MPITPPPLAVTAGVPARPGCAVCRGPGDATAALFDLGSGVRVWLCDTHRDPAFLVARDGRDLTDALAATWVSVGALTLSRRRALDAHLALLGPRDPVAVPRRRGSYAWPTLRIEVRERLARGEDPRTIIDEVRRAAAARAGSEEPTPPSVSTIRRWLREDRLVAQAPGATWPNGEPHALPRDGTGPGPRPYRR